MFGRLLCLLRLGWLDGGWLLLCRGLLYCGFLGFGSEESGFGFGKEIELAFARDAPMPCKGETDGKAGELVVACAFDKGTAETSSALRFSFSSDISSARSSAKV